MKKIFLVIPFIAITVSAFVYFHEIEVPYNAFYEICEHGYYPDAYVVFHDEDAFLKSPVYLNNGEKIEKTMKGKFDFSNYSYVIVYGAQIERMYYSFKGTMFDDKSPSYASARRSHKQCLFIEYKEPDDHIYIYQINRNPNLMGFGGD